MSEQIYTVVLPDGREVEVESDHEPTKDEAIKIMRSFGIEPERKSTLDAVKGFFAEPEVKAAGARLVGGLGGAMTGAFRGGPIGGIVGGLVGAAAAEPIAQTITPREEGVAETLTNIGLAGIQPKRSVGNLLQRVGREAVIGGGLGAAQATVVPLFDEGRLPTQNELLMGGGLGAGIGGVLGGVLPGPKGAPKTTPITDQLGNASTKNTTTEANQAANAIAMTPPKPVVPPAAPAQPFIPQAGAPKEFGFQQDARLRAELEGFQPPELKVPMDLPQGEEKVIRPTQSIADDILGAIGARQMGGVREARPAISEREALIRYLDNQPGLQRAQRQRLGLPPHPEDPNPWTDVVPTMERPKPVEAERSAISGRAKEQEEFALKEPMEFGQLSEREIKAPEKKSGVLAGEAPTIIKPLEVAGVGEPPKPTIRQIELEGGAQGQGLIINSGITDAQGNPIWVNVRTGKAVEAPTYQGPRSGPEPRTFRNQAVKYIGDQELGEGQFMSLYNLTEDIVDDAGNVLHPANSTVSAQTLEKYGIPVPEAPKPPVELVLRPSGEVGATQVSPEPVAPVKGKETPLPAVQETKPAAQAKTEAEKLADTRAYLKGEQDRYNAAARALEAHPKAGEIIPLFDKANELAETARSLRDHPLDYPPARRAAATRAATKARDAAEKAYKDAGFGVKDFYDVWGSYSMAEPPKIKAAAETKIPRRASVSDEAAIEAEAARQAKGQAGFISPASFSIAEPAIAALGGKAAARITGQDEETENRWTAAGFALGHFGNMAGKRMLVRFNKDPKLLNMTAFHGTPHNVEREVGGKKVKAFDISKIGTGEGAQVYGHGIYIAEARKVGENYRDALSKDMVGRNNYRRGRYSVNEWKGVNAESPYPYDGGPVVLGKLTGEVRVANAKNRAYPDENIPEVEIITNTGDVDWLSLSEVSFKGQELTYSKIPKSGGNLYQVEFDAKPEELLVWDKPMSQHPESVKSVLRGLGVPDEYLNAKPGTMGDRTGEEIYRWVGQRAAVASKRPFGKDGFRRTAEAASEALSKAGIKGIKYADQVSRGQASRDSHEIIDGATLSKREARFYGESKMPDHMKGRLFVVEKGGVQPASGALKVNGGDNPISGWKTPEQAKNALNSIPEATNNYVVFSDRDIKITHENDIEIPESLRGLQAGITGSPATAAVAGGAIGYASGDTPEEKARLAGLGALAGLGVGAAATRAASRPSVKPSATQATRPATRADMMKDFAPQMPKYEAPPPATAKLGPPTLFNKAPEATPTGASGAAQAAAPSGTQATPSPVGTATKGAAAETVSEKWLNENRPIRNFDKRIIDNPDVPQEMRDALASNPDIHYEIAHHKQTARAAAGSTDAELEMMVKSGDLAERTAALNEQSNRAAAKGDMAESARLHNLASQNLTPAAQQVSLARFLWSPWADLAEVEGAVVKTGRNLTEEQRKRVVELSINKIEAEKALAEIERLAKESFTDENIKKLRLAKVDAALARKAYDEYAIGLEPKFLGDILSKAIQGNLLTPLSLVANVFGNMFWLPVRKLGGAAGSLIDLAYSKSTGDPRSIMQGNPFPSVAELKAALEGAKVAGKELLTGPSVESYAKAEVNRGFQPIRSLLQGITGKDLPVGKDGQVLKWDRTKSIIEGLVGGPPEVFFRLLNLGDKPFRRAAEVEAAREFASLKGLKGRDLEYFLTFPTKKGAKELDEMARRATFTQENKLISQLNKFLDADAIKKDLPAAAGVIKAFNRMVVPFRQFPVNYVQSAINFVSPEIALAKAIYYSAAGNHRKARIAAGEAMVGAAIYSAAEHLWRAGIISEPTSKDAKTRSAQYDRMGPQKFNISGLERNLNGEDGTYRTGDKLVDWGKMGIPAAVFYLTTQSNSEKLLEEAGAGKVPHKPKISDPLTRRMEDPASVIQSFPGLLSFSLDQSFLAGASSLLEAWKDPDPDSGKFQVWAANMFRAVTSMAIPNTAEAVARARMEFVPELKGDTNLETFKNIFKFKMNMMDPEDRPLLKRDLWGEPIRRAPKDSSGAWAQQMFDVVKYGRTEVDPFKDKLMSVYNETEKPDVYPTPPTRVVSFGGSTVKLLPNHYEQLQETVGRMRRQVAEKVVNTAGFNRLSAMEKVYVLERVYSEAGSAATTQFLTRRDILDEYFPMFTGKGRQSENERTRRMDTKSVIAERAMNR